jgi:hypothetical protein
MIICAGEFETLILRLTLHILYFGPLPMLGGVEALTSAGKEKRKKRGCDAS